MVLTICCWMSASGAHGRELMDQTGRTVQVPDRPQRVVSLMPSITEEVFDLDRQGLLIGVTLYAKEPAAAALLPRVGSYVHPDIERIVALRPDLCLVMRDGNPLQVVRRVQKLGISVFALAPRTLPGIIDSIQLLGRLLHAEDRADMLAVQMQDKLARVEQRVAAVSRRPRVFFQIDAAPLISAGRDTLIDRLIRRAGGINLAAAKVAYPRYSWEDILVMRPQVVLIASMAGGYSDRQLRAVWQKWPSIPAVRDNRIYVVDASLFDRPTPRLFDGLILLADLLHPADWQGGAEPSPQKQTAGR